MKNQMLQKYVKEWRSLLAFFWHDIVLRMFYLIECFESDFWSITGSKNDKPKASRRCKKTMSKKKTGEKNQQKKKLNLKPSSNDKPVGITAYCERWPQKLCRFLNCVVTLIKKELKRCFKMFHKFVFTSCRPVSCNAPVHVQGTLITSHRCDWFQFFLWIAIVGIISAIKPIVCIHCCFIALHQSNRQHFSSKHEYVSKYWNIAIAIAIVLCHWMHFLKFNKFGVNFQIQILSKLQKPSIIFCSNTFEENIYKIKN